MSVGATPTGIAPAARARASAFENLDHIFHTLFDDFCDADEPERYLGTSLRTEKEVALMTYLQAAAWSEIVEVAGRLAHVMVRNDPGELVRLHEPPTGARSATGTRSE
ncbi:hypothetical protein [Streptomyces sp. NPDC017988]|uniref:hypothetical protein n=1 Tax=Streptomyces sp. NPDC017988 TaxID=3365025 RepID=UPI003793FC7C